MPSLMVTICTATVGFLLQSSPVQAATDTKRTQPYGKFDGDVEGDYSTGKYGAQKSTDTETITPSLYWSIFDSTTLSLSIPFVNQNAPRGTIGSGGHGNGANAHRGSKRGQNNQSVTTNGIGDVVLGIDQDVLEQSDHYFVDVGAFANAKFGTADVSKGLGSGKNDFSFGGRIGHSWSEYALTGELGYVLVGNPGQVTANGVTTVLDYHNAFYADLHGTRKINDRTTVGVGFSNNESYERGQVAARVVSADVSYGLTSTVKLKGKVLAGLNDNSPDFGLRLTVAFPL